MSWLAQVIVFLLSIFFSVDVGEVAGRKFGVMTFMGLMILLNVSNEICRAIKERK